MTTTATAPTTTTIAKARPKPRVLLGGVLAAGVAVYGVYSWGTYGHEGTDDAQVGADVVGISTHIGGTVRKVLVNDNQAVKKGDPLIEIDPTDWAARVKQGEADLAASRAQADAADAQVAIVEATSRGGLTVARANLSGTTRSAAGAEAGLESAKAALARAEAHAVRADNDFARAEALFRDGAIAAAEVDTARSNAFAARATVAQERAQLAGAMETKRTAQTDIDEARGRVEQSAPVEAQLAAARANATLAHARIDAAEAALVLAKLQLSYTRIEAPVDGSLARLAVREGQLVAPGQAIVSVVPNTTYVLANFKETQVGRMHVGQRAEIKVDAFPGRVFEGHVESLSPGTGAHFALLPPDNASGNFVKIVQRVPVKIAWSNVPPDIALRVGVSADATVFTR
ncbi:HlyD family secretion protein [Pendulispora brunnea]|uniref:HlyD family secretion protein n=1 Tax=Pendulispora brunnea TaxID=2905690 RepID=A0ABZ2K0B2_9BACT